MSEAPKPYLAAVVQAGNHALCRPAHIDEDALANAYRMVAWIDRISGEQPEQPRLFCFPTLPLYGASQRPVTSRDHAIRLDGPLGPAFDLLIERCAARRCYIGMTASEMTDVAPGGFVHSGIVLGPEGIVLSQPKFGRHRDSEIPDLRERLRSWIEKLGPDATNRVVDTPIGRLAILIEVEHWTPETVRTRVKAGADVLLHSNLEFRDVDVPFAALKQSIAFQNHVFFVSANAAYERWDEPLPVFRKGKGDSLIVGPTGQVLARVDQGGANYGEGYAVATIDLAQVRAARERYAGETVPIWDMYADTYFSRR